MTTENTSAPAAVDEPTSAPDFNIFEDYEPEESSLFTASPAAEETEAKVDTTAAENPADEAETPTDPASSESKTGTKAETPEGKSTETKKDEPEDKEGVEDGYAHGSQKVRDKYRNETTVAELRQRADQSQELYRVATTLKAQNDGWQQERAQMAQAIQQQQNLLENALALVGEQLPKAPSLELAQQDPYEYTIQKAQYEAAMEKVGAFRQQAAERKSMEQRAQVEQHQKVRQHGEQWLQQTHPLFANPQFRPAFEQAFTEIGRKVGFKDEELAQVTDPRLRLFAAEAVKGQLWESKAQGLQKELDALRAEKAEAAKALAAKAEEKAKAVEAAPVQTPQVRINPRQRENQQLADRLKSLRSSRGRQQINAAEAILSDFD